MNIGFIGMGIMGSRMAMNLLEAGNDLTNSIKELYGLAEKQGLGRKDFAAIYALLAKDTSGDS